MDYKKGGSGRPFLTEAIRIEQPRAVINGKNLDNIFDLSIYDPIISLEQFSYLRIGFFRNNSAKLRETSQSVDRDYYINRKQACVMR